MADARPNPFDFDVTKIFGDFRFRPFDVEAAWAAQRRNIEALSQANQLAVESMQTVAKRHIELTRETFEGFSALWRDLAAPASSGKPRTSTSDTKGPICFGAKLMTAATCRPTSASRW